MAIILLFVTTIAFAQNTDSLKRELTNAASAKVRSGISYTISKLAFDQSQFDTPVIYGKRSAYSAK